LESAFIGGQHGGALVGAFLHVLHQVGGRLGGALADGPDGFFRFGPQFGRRHVGFGVDLDQRLVGVADDPSGRRLDVANDPFDGALAADVLIFFDQVVQPRQRADVFLEVGRHGGALIPGG